MLIPSRQCSTNSCSGGDEGRCWVLSGLEPDHRDKSDTVSGCNEQGETSSNCIINIDFIHRSQSASLVLLVRLMLGHRYHSLALDMRPISFSNLMASVMSPLIRSFPDMKAIVGFSWPETAQKTNRQRVEQLRLDYMVGQWTIILEQRFLHFTSHTVTIVVTHLGTSYWSQQNPLPWRHQLWQAADPGLRCQSRSSGPETKHLHVPLIWT